MKTNQTAVQWLVDQINSDCTNSTFVRPELVEKALEMEKDQCINDRISGMKVAFEASNKELDMLLRKFKSNHNI